VALLRFLIHYFSTPLLLIHSQGEGAELLSLFIFLWVYLLPSSQKMPPIFLFEECFYVLLDETTATVDSKLTRSAWLLPMRHLLAFGTLFATGGQHEPGIQNTCALYSFGGNPIYQERDTSNILTHMPLPSKHVHWQTTLLQSYSRDKPPDVVRPQVHQGKVVKIRKRWQFLLFDPIGGQTPVALVSHTTFCMINLMRTSGSLLSPDIVPVVCYRCLHKLLPRPLKGWGL
jgi:hypothetical protein